MIYVEHGVTKSIELSHVWSGCLGRTPQQAIIQPDRLGRFRFLLAANYAAARKSARFT